MSKMVLRNSWISVDGVDLSDKITSVELEADTDVDVSAFGSPVRSLLTPRMCSASFYVIDTPTTAMEAVWGTARERSFRFLIEPPVLKVDPSTGSRTCEFDVASPGAGGLWALLPSTSRQLDDLAGTFRMLETGELPPDQALKALDRHLTKAHVQIDVTPEEGSDEALDLKARRRAIEQAPTEQFRQALVDVYELDDWAKAHGVGLVVEMQGDAEDPKFEYSFVSLETMEPLPDLT